LGGLTGTIQGRDELDDLPAHMTVLGGAYTGIQLAQALRRLGSWVTNAEPGRQLKGREDTNVSDGVRGILSGEGIDILPNARPLSVHGLFADAAAVTVHKDDGERTIAGSHLSQSAGREFSRYRPRQGRNRDGCVAPTTKWTGEAEDVDQRCSYDRPDAWRVG
jgi:pyruvate/2-oxoglutarate dehydrogenase complex dihydrolipoamide dehydrogenase (E3) component